MTKTSQLNDMAIIICHDGCPILIISIPCFCHYFDENQMKDMQNEKRNSIIIETNDKNKSTN